MRLAIAQPCFGSSGDGFQNQQVQRTLHQIAWFSHTMIIYNMKCRLSRY